MILTVVLLFVVLPLAAYAIVWAVISVAAGRRWGTRGRVITAAIFIPGIFVVVIAPFWWATMTSEDDYGAPPIGRIALPSSAQITASGSDCASGGCWAAVSLSPSEGASREQMMRDLEKTERCTAGSLFDPRAVCWEHAPGSTAHDLIARYQRPW
ncbi:MAG: hypothetical protein QM708_07170 [Propioniciclava sp.]|uniref:hypothetical protein n=1 Tax=Propioniciclava sp. TaxID=2038686 RepID=UPI0039E6EA24